MRKRDAAVEKERAERSLTGAGEGTSAGGPGPAEARPKPDEEVQISFEHNEADGERPETAPEPAAAAGAAEVPEEAPRAAPEPTLREETGEESGSAGAPPDPLGALRAERDQIYDRWLRVQADFDNYRKRVERDREEFRRTALESLLQDLVHVVDNFERALGSLPPETPKGIAQGVTLIHKQLLDVLARRGLVPMETASGPFDPHRHEAVAAEERSDVPHHQVLAEARRGYLLGERVLRPALVKVSVRPEAEPTPEEPGERTVHEAPDAAGETS